MPVAPNWIHCNDNYRQRTMRKRHSLSGRNMNTKPIGMAVITGASSGIYAIMRATEGA